jgi:DUF1680 family protein
MKTILFTLAALLLAPLAAVAMNHPAAVSPQATLRGVEVEAVKWTEGFWANKFELCRSAMLPSVEAALLDERNSEQLANFKIAAGLEHGQYHGTDWSDGDCYKWIEAMACMYAITRDATLDRKMDEWIGIIAKAQASDGYLSTGEFGEFGNSREFGIREFGIRGIRRNSEFGNSELGIRDASLFLA